MAKPKVVEIEKDGQKGKCLESALAGWQRNGWTAVDTSNSESGEVPDDQPVEPVEVPVADQNEGGDQ